MSSEFDIEDFDELKQIFLDLSLRPIILVVGSLSFKCSVETFNYCVVQVFPIPAMLQISCFFSAAVPHGAALI